MVAYNLVIKVAASFLLSLISNVNRLGTCMGLAIPNVGGAWFIAHIDCNAAVQRPEGATYSRVVLWIIDKLLSLLGAKSPFAVGTFVHIIGNLADFSSRATRYGVTQWSTFPIDIVGMDSFSIDAAEVFQRMVQEENNGNGDAELQCLPRPLSVV